MFTLIAAGAGSAHSFALWAVAAPFRCQRCLLLPIGVYSRRRPQLLGMDAGLALERRAQLGFQMARKDCIAFSK